MLTNFGKFYLSCYREGITNRGFTDNTEAHGGKN